MRLLRLLPLALFLLPPLYAQTQAEVDGVIAETIPHQKAMDTQAKAFTRVEVVRDRNYNEKGKQIVDSSNTFETVFIADLPYLRWTARNGKALSGKDADEEQQRYDAAVHERTGLSMEQKSMVLHKHVIKSDLSLKDVATEFSHQLLRHETIDKHDTWVVLCTPKDPAIHPVAFTLAVDPARSFIARVDFRYDKDAGELLAGSYGTNDLFAQDGAALARTMEMHFRVKIGGTLITGESDHTYSNYHRYLASARIVDMKEIPDGEQVKK